MLPRLRKFYVEEVVPQMMKRFGYRNPMQVPRLKKIVVNMGVGAALQDVKILDKAMEELGIITGQKPIIRRAKKAISNFKIRQGNPIACKVTLRRARMYEFLDRFVNIALPRIRDFRGLNPDGFNDGCYSVGISEQTIFPEIEYDRITRMQGMDITIVTDAGNPEEARELLRLFGIPFRSS